jgi:hypothetical protein
VQEFLCPFEDGFPPVAERHDTVQFVAQESFGLSFRGFGGHPETVAQYPGNSLQPRMVDMDDEQPKGSALLEKAWAIAGLLAAAALAWMAIDLLIPRKPAEADSDAGS